MMIAFIITNYNVYLHSFANIKLGMVGNMAFLYQGNESLTKSLTFVDEIFKSIFLAQNTLIFIQISLKYC